MTRSRLLLAIASVLAGTAVLFGVLGLAYNPVLLVLATPFGAAAYFLWAGATGRVERRAVRSTRSHSRGAATPGGHRARHSREGGRSAIGPRAARFAGVEGRREASRILRVPHDADAETVRRAYRDRVKEVHPDNGGDEAAFRRVAAAYDRLRS